MPAVSGARSVADAGSHAAALERARAATARPRVDGGRLPAAARRLLRGDRLASTRYEARGDRHPPARSTTSPSRRLQPTRRSSAPIRHGGSARSGPAFHALAEINVAGWTSWVASTGSTWYAAGVEARRRMAAAGYDVAAGDTWALNELSSAVRQGVGIARANMRAFLRACYDGDGVLPSVQGAVFVTGIGQSDQRPLPLPGAAAGLVRGRGFLDRPQPLCERLVAGALRRRPRTTPSPARRQTRARLAERVPPAPTSLAGVAPAAAAAARTFLAPPTARSRTRPGSTTPPSAGRTSPVDLMQDYVSAQTYAMRSAGTAASASPGRRGTSPAPRSRLQHTDRRAACAARGCDRRLGRSPGGRLRLDLVQPHLDGAALRPAGAPSPRGSHPSSRSRRRRRRLSPGAPSAPLTVELRTSSWVRIHGRSTGDGGAVLVLADGRVLGHSAGPWTATPDGVDRVGAEHAELLLPRRRQRLGHDRGCGGRQDHCDTDRHDRRPARAAIASGPTALVGRLRRLRRFGPRSLDPSERRAGCACRRHDAHVRAHSQEPRRPGVTRVRRRPTPLAGRLHGQPVGPRFRLHRHDNTHVRSRLLVRGSGRDRAGAGRRPPAGHVDSHGDLFGTAG